MSKNKKKNNTKKIQLEKWVYDDIKRLSVFMEVPVKSKDDIADLFHLLVQEKLEFYDNSIFEINQKENGIVKKSKYEIAQENLRTTLIEYAKANDLHDPLFELLDDPDLIRGHLILKSTLKSSALEKLCSQYIGMYDGIDMNEFLKPYKSIKQDIEQDSETQNP